MSAYIIVQAKITDPEKFKAYPAEAAKLVAKFGGTYRVLGGTAEGLEGEWSESKVVMSEWPDYETALAFWRSPEYSAVKSLREGAADVVVFAVDGVNQQQLS